jgi:hypothetical protein
MIMQLVRVASAALGALLCAVSAPAFAGGCRAECYERGDRTVTHVPAIVQARPTRVQVAPSRVYREHVPAVYGAVVRRELVHSGYTTYAYQPPIIERRYEHVVTQPASVRWKRTVHCHGRERVCQVAVPARVRQVSHDVVVVPARHRSVSTPALYRDVAVPVMLSPARTRTVVVPGAHRVDYRPVVLKAAEVHVSDPGWRPIRHRHQW